MLQSELPCSTLRHLQTMAHSWPPSYSSLQPLLPGQKPRGASQHASSSRSCPPLPASKSTPAFSTQLPPDQSRPFTSLSWRRDSSSMDHGPVVARIEGPIIPDTLPQPDPYRPFFVPQAVLFDSPISPQTDSRILQLPPEILSLIFQEVKVPYFQISLALTCKILARTAYQKDAMSPWRGYRDKDGLFRLLERKNNWIPSSLRLCRACFRFIPSDRTYWEEQIKTSEFDNLKVNWYDVFSWFETPFQQHRCPWCTVSNYTGYFREDKYIDDKDTTPRARRYPMCPDVTRRIMKP